MKRGSVNDELTRLRRRKRRSGVGWRAIAVTRKLKFGRWMQVKGMVEMDGRRRLSGLLVTRRIRR
jgi:hypothetical protein